MSKLLSLMIAAVFASVSVAAVAADKKEEKAGAKKAAPAKAAAAKDAPKAKADKKKKEEAKK